MLLSSQDAYLAAPWSNGNYSWNNQCDLTLPCKQHPDPPIIIVDEYVIPAELNTALRQGYAADGVTLVYGHMAQEVDIMPIDVIPRLNETEYRKYISIIE